MQMEITSYTVPINPALVMTPVAKTFGSGGGGGGATFNIYTIGSTAGSNTFSFTAASYATSFNTVPLVGHKCLLIGVNLALFGNPPIPESFPITITTNGVTAYLANVAPLIGSVIIGAISTAGINTIALTGVGAGTEITGGIITTYYVEL